MKRGQGFTQPRGGEKGGGGAATQPDVRKTRGPKKVPPQKGGGAVGPHQSTHSPKSRKRQIFSPGAFGANPPTPKRPTPP